MKPSLLLFPLFVTAIPRRENRDASQATLGCGTQRPLSGPEEGAHQDGDNTKLTKVVDALKVMQSEYFEIFSATWPDCNDWTAAVMGTQVSATLSSIVASFSPIEESCTEAIWWQNTVNRYFAHTFAFYFGENAFSLRNQAYDDMLWVVLGWLESIKFSNMYSRRHFQTSTLRSTDDPAADWHGLQFNPAAAHRARVFYELASKGWDEDLCHGGMNWNPYLIPYKNAITNQLYAAASIAMYLYFPGDNNTSPFVVQDQPTSSDAPRTPGQQDPQYLENAIKSYKWLQDSGMISSSGLWQDGFHIKGWQRHRDGTIDRGTGECNELNTMTFTYNQGVILSASRGLWLATGARSYLDDGHALIESVVYATGWPMSRDDDPNKWQGMGRNGVMEEFCDVHGQCSQDAQTFKGIFFHHLSEFCRPLWATEEEDFATTTDFDHIAYKGHLDRCAAYKKWIEHNAAMAESTLDSKGRFGMWWTDRKFADPSLNSDLQLMLASTFLPEGAIDYKSPYDPKADAGAPPAWAIMPNRDFNDRGRGRTVETQAGGLAVLRARWNWEVHF